MPHLARLEDEAIFILREACAEREKPALLFSGGKDSIVMLRLAEKAFRPARFPFPLLHVDTGHNFDEVIAFRDRRAAELGERLIVARVQDSIDRGTVREDTGPRASRNRLQSVTLLEADLRQTLLEGAEFERCALLKATLSGMRLVGMRFPFTQFTEAALAGCRKSRPGRVARERPARGQGGHRCSHSPLSSNRSP